MNYFTFFASIIAIASMQSLVSAAVYRGPPGPNVAGPGNIAGPVGVGTVGGPINGVGNNGIKQNYAQVVRNARYGTGSNKRQAKRQVNQKYVENQLSGVGSARVKYNADQAYINNNSEQ